MYLFIARWAPGGLSRGGMHECVCRWEPVPLAVGHDLAYLLWNSSYKGSEHYLLSLFYYNYAYTLLAVGAYEGGCPCAASATDALRGGGCPCAHALLRYLVNSQHWPQTFSNSLFNSSTTNWLQPGVAT
jgi:hypothetical protein